MEMKPLQRPFNLFGHYLDMNIIGENVTTSCISAILVHHLEKVMSHALEKHHHGFTDQRCHLLGWACLMHSIN